MHHGVLPIYTVVVDDNHGTKDSKQQNDVRAAV